MAYIGKTPTSVPLTSSDVTDGIISTAKIADTAITNAKLNADIISGDTALGAEPADTDELLVSDAGVLKRMDYSYIKGGGKILQVVSTTKTDTFSDASGSFADITGLSASITPAATSSKILIFGTTYACNTAGDITTQIVRDSTPIAIGDASSSRGRSTTGGSLRQTYELLSHSFNYLDSPSTTSSTTYKIQVRTGGGTVYVNKSDDDADNSNAERTVSTITLMEIGA